ncbi:MAG TPA: GNAT family N-acetyltransferase [Longimicrobiaceae bacterium]
MSPPLVRTARPEDAGPLARLLTELGYPTTPEQAAARLDRLLPDPAHRALLAEADGVVVGFAGVFSGYAYHADEPYARVLALVVDPAHRGGGVGAALMAEAEAWARERGAAAVHLTAATHREGAHRFYRRMGYRETGTRFYRRLD